MSMVHAQSPHPSVGEGQGEGYKNNKELHLLIPCLPAVRENCTLNKIAGEHLQVGINRA